MEPTSKKFRCSAPDTNKVERVPASSMFIFIGAQPRTDWLAGVVERDERGFILTGPDLVREGSRPQGWTLDRDPYLLETNVAGLFAVGDVRHGSVKRVASGVGEGLVAVAVHPSVFEQGLVRFSRSKTHNCFGVPAFAGLPDDRITWFINQCQEINLKAGDSYFREGDPADAMFVILSGEGQVRGAVSGDLVMFEMKAGTVTGVLPFSRMKQFTYAARAITDVCALRFPASQFFLNSCTACPSSLSVWWE